MAASAPAVELRGIRKSFGGVRALKGVDLAVARGEVHAVLGPNGAGKSTLIKVLCGVVEPDEGELLRDGKPLRIASPADAQAAGIAVVHQELTMIPDLTVAENIGASALPTRAGLVDRRAMRTSARAVLARLGFALDVDRRVAELSLAARQIVEIARALVAGGDVLVLDEPNSALTAVETERLLEIVRGLAADGTTVVLISHRLEEVFAVADRLTVLRDGASVGSWQAAETDVATVVHAMVGDVRETRPAAAARPAAGPPLLRLERARHGALGPLDLDVRAGEVLALVGLEGSGIETALELVGGVVASRGAVALEGASLRLRSPRDAIDRGVVYVPPDRKTAGLWLERSIEDNIAAGRVSRFARHGIVRRRALRSDACRWIERLEIKAASPASAAGQLSGGNQQRVLLARALAMEPRVLLISDPTRGVDVAAKAAIHATIREAAAGGIAVVVASAEFDEALVLADRVVCMRKGTIAAEGSTSEFDEHALTQLAGASG